MNCRPALLLVIAIVMPAAARAQMTSAPGVVIEEAAVRIDPTARVPLTTLSRGTDVTVLSVQESWVQIAFELGPGPPQAGSATGAHLVPQQVASTH